VRPGWYDDDGYDDMSPAVVLTTERTSRKLRTCANCLGAILPGDRYLRRFLPPDAEHATSMTIIEHASPGTCYVVMTQLT
jgi:hypothetical protein